MDTLDAPANTPQAVLQQAMQVMRPLALWLMRSGVGHASFSAALKPLFLECAREELLRNQGKVSDSALSLLCGLHRKDVRALAGVAVESGLRQPKASPAQQVVNSRGRPFPFPVIPAMLAGISLVDGLLLATVIAIPWLLAGMVGALLTWVAQRLVRGD